MRWGWHRRVDPAPGPRPCDRPPATHPPTPVAPTLRRSIAQTAETAQLPLAALIAKATQVQVRETVRGLWGKGSAKCAPPVFGRDRCFTEYFHHILN